MQKMSVVEQQVRTVGARHIALRDTPIRESTSTSVLVVVVSAESVGATQNVGIG